MRLGDLLSSNVYANNFPTRIFQWMPIGDPDSFDVRSVRALAVDLDARNRLACTYNGLYDVLDLLSDLRDHLAHRTPDVISNRDPTYFGQVLIDHQVMAIGAKKSRCRFIN